MTTRNNPGYLDRNHPVRFLIEAGATGRRITKRDLSILEQIDTSTDANLARFSSTVDGANQAVVQVHKTEGHGAARRIADEFVAKIAGRMNKEEAAITSSITPDDPTADMTAFANKIFDN